MTTEPSAPAPAEAMFITRATADEVATIPHVQPFPTGASVGSDEAILGGVIAAVILLLLCCCTFLVLRYMFKDKGSYLTYESGDGESVNIDDTEPDGPLAPLETGKDE